MPQVLQNLGQMLTKKYCPAQNINNVPSLEMLKKMCYEYTMEFYSAIRNNDGV
jgi:hypothetical protein